MICSQAGLPTRWRRKEFIDAFNAKYGEIKQYAPYFYDGANLLIAAMQKADSPDPAKYLPEMHKISYDGATGHIEFDDKGDRKDAEITIFQMKAGKVEPVAIVKGGKSTKIGGEASAAAPAAPAAPGDGARDGAGTEEVTAAATTENGACGRRSHISRGAKPTAGRRLAAAPPRSTEGSASNGSCRQQPAARTIRHRFAFRFRAFSLAWTSSCSNGERADARQRVCRRGARLHDGLRDHPAHQLRARRSGDDRCDGRAVGHQCARRREPRLAAARDRHRAGVLVAVPVCMAVGYALERVAYRPLRRAPRLAPLITAIGLSIILQHVALIVWSRNPLSFPQIVEVVSYHVTGNPDGRAITNVQIAIIVTSVADDGRAARARSTGRSSASRCARRRKTSRSRA